MIFALIGNQNCGKTTLFNQLTGSSQHVGNFPGVTVEKKEGTLKSDKNVTVVDLPGIYSISPYTSEEIVTRDFLIKDKPDGIINIIDATNIERNLYLTLQLLEMRIPMVLALNMMDEVKSSGGSIDTGGLSEALQIPVIPICASKNEGVAELAEIAVKTAAEKSVPAHLDFCTGPVHRAIHSISHVIEDHAALIDVPVRFAATKLVEGDKPMLSALKLSDNEKDIIDHTVTEMETSLGTDREAALADMRYDYIEKLCKKCVDKPHGPSKEQERTEKIDAVLTNKYLAIPIFLCIMALIFYLTFGLIGGNLSDLMQLGIDKLTAVTDVFLRKFDVADGLRSLIIDGIFKGVYHHAFLSAFGSGGQRIHGENCLRNGQTASQDRTFGTLVRSAAHRIRMFRTRYYVYAHTFKRPRQAYDNSAYSVYLMQRKSSDIRRIYTDILFRKSRACNDVPICFRNYHGYTCGNAFQKDSVQGKTDSVCNGTSRIQISVNEKRYFTYVGKSCGLFKESIYGYFLRNDTHMAA